MMVIVIIPCCDPLFCFITFLQNYKGQDFYAHFKGRETEAQSGSEHT